MEKPEILSFILSSPSPVTKQEIARAFNLKGSGSRVELKKALRALEDQGAITKNAGGAYSAPDGLPSVTTIEITDVTVDGDVFAQPAGWNVIEQGAAPRIEVMPDKKGRGAPSAGDKALARLKRIEVNAYEATIMRRIDEAQNRVLGVVRITKKGPILEPSNRKAKFDFDIEILNGAKDGDMALAEPLPSRGRHRSVKIIEVIGSKGDPKSISLLSMYEAGINPKFPKDVIDETNGMSVPSPEKREDLRDTPLVTIDGADAKDFDDAVFAEKDGAGFHLIVAIADVAYYVRPYSALDKEAWKRGNSTYFPDRVVPMLPEALSNDLCSIRPNEPRACLAVHMWIDENGKMIRHKFVRGLMKSAARLTYEQVQHIHDSLSPIHGGEGKGEGEGACDLKSPSPQPSPPLREGEGELWRTVIAPLYAAYAVLDEARKQRGALDLDLPERKIVLDKEGRMTGVTKRLRLNSHKLIEEFMILANVAAAEALEARKAPCVYRIHDRPSADKLNSVREFIDSFGFSLPKGQVADPKQLNYILQQAAKSPYSHLISMVMLRSQSQAVYSADNIGHFGLALKRYAHFTSPIRRYADLIIHRALITAYNLGPGGLDDGEIARLEETCHHISDTERTSMEAERSSVDRFAAGFLSTQIGAQFSGRITGVTRFGLFVELTESGADGLVPIRTLPNDFYIHDEKAHALIGRRHGVVFRLGAPVTVVLKEADPITGSALLNLVNGENGADIPGMEFKRRPGGYDRGHDPREKRGKGRPDRNPRDKGDRPNYRKHNKKDGKKRR